MFKWFWAIFSMGRANYSTGVPMQGSSWVGGWLFFSSKTVMHSINSKSVFGETSWGILYAFNRASSENTLNYSLTCAGCFKEFAHFQCVCISQFKLSVRGKFCLCLKSIVNKLQELWFPSDFFVIFCWLFWLDRVQRSITY